MPVAVQAQFYTPQPPASVQRTLQSCTAAQEGGFVLMHRLSGAGVVVRTLKAPETDKPLFGTVRQDSFAIAFVPSKQDITPFHPIMRGQLTATEDGGTLLEAELAHHPDARTWAPLYGFGAAVVATGSVLRFQDQLHLLIGGVALSLLFAVFPTLQARVRFGGACESAIGALEGLLQLERRS